MVRPRPRLTPELLDAPVSRTARAVAHEFLEAAVAERGRLPEGGEALHDFRVAIRRLRSWLRAFRPSLDDTVSGRTRRALAALADASNQARDAEVGLEWLAAQRHAHPHARREARALQARLRRELRAAMRRLHRHLADEFETTVLRLDGEVAETVSATTREAKGSSAARVLAALIRRHARALAAALGRVHGPGDEAAAHRARIAGKRLRYLIEPLDADPEARRVVQRLKRLQDALGEFHDACVLGARLPASGSALEDRVRTRIALAFTRVRRGWLGRKPAEVRSAADRVAHRLADAEADRLDGEARSRALSSGRSAAS